MATHELTHRAQFEGNDWLRGYFGGLVHGLLSSLELQPMSLLERALKVVSSSGDPGPGSESTPIGIRLLDEDQRKIFDKLQAMMSVVEGHGNFLMDAAAANTIPTQPRMRRSLQSGSWEGPLGKVMRRLLGLDLKRAQYEEGQKFFDAVSAAAGSDGVRAAFQSPKASLTLDEIRGPRPLAHPDQPLRPAAAERVLVALSGGPDSTALALLLVSRGCDVVLGHVDHAIREDSAADARHCRDVAAGLGLPIEVVRLEEPPAGEAGARAARYEALERMADRVGASAIATGHTLDDDAETVLLRLGRGGYPLGIPLQRGRVVRPLLAMRRRETAELCRRRGVPVLTDPTNLDERFARNRIRHRVLPLLGDEGVLELARVAEATREVKARHDAAIDHLAAAIARTPAPGTVLRLDRPALAALPPQLREGVLRRVLQSLGVEPSSRLVRDLSMKLVPVPGARLDLPGGLTAWAEADELLAGHPVPVPPAATLRSPGTTCLPKWGIQVITEVVAPPESPRTGPWEAVLDGRAAALPLAVRPRQPGDRYRPLGAPGHRKLQDVLVDRKVARAARDRVPLLTAGGRLAWVVGHGIDHDFRITAESVSALRIRISPLSPEGAPEGAPEALLSEGLLSEGEVAP